MALTLLGVLVIVAGFAAGLNPLLVVTAAAIVTGLAGGLDVVEVISAFGKAFNENRYVSVVFLVLPVIGALERAGLQERARELDHRPQGDDDVPHPRALYARAADRGGAGPDLVRRPGADGAAADRADGGSRSGSAARAPARATPASGYARRRARRTISVSSSARTSSSPSARSC